VGFLRRFVYVSGAFVLIAALALLLFVRASLPQLVGTRALSGLAGIVRISRDDIGVVTIDAADRRDAALATGFVHAQERFFQMDLMRRLAAGELAALVGEAAADHDIAQRVHRMRGVARAVVLASNDDERAIIDAYTAGVNAGMAALAARPFEYLILRAYPSPWRAEDTVLVVLAMYFRLHDERASRESALGRLRDTLPPRLFAFLTQAGTPWDAPLVGGAAASLPVPDASVCDLRAGRGNAVVGHSPLASAGLKERIAVGSNAWALSPRRTRTGVPMVANDMHLGLSMPNTWFRLRLRVEDASRPGANIDVSGVSLPGAPVIVAGSNGKVAWGLTNTYGDWVDLVVLERDPLDPHRYRTPDGYRRFREHTETIHIRGAAPRTLVVVSTIWGPVIDSDAGGELRALRWLAHESEATNMALIGMESARDVGQAIDVAHRSGIPPQNLILADIHGNIAWTVMGRIPNRRGYDPLLPSSWANPGQGWFGWLPPEDYPVVLNPASGALWSANSRAVEGAPLAAIGDGGYALGARATQIRDSLLALDGATEADMLEIQLDDRAQFLAPWRQLLLQVLTPAAVMADGRRAELRRVVESGARRAAVGDAGYRLLRDFRLAVAGRVLAAIAAGCGAADTAESATKLRQWEGALWRVLEERPDHLLDPRYDSWDAFLLAATDSVIAACENGDLERCSWGNANVVTIRHPLSRAIPLLASWLDMPARPLPGDTHMPRVQGPAMGASQRFAVSPGRESDGYMHMPGGQSGHPMSPFYAASHGAWVDGTPTSFLPGADKYRLTLIPAGAQ
jgi:penicillin amidase